jgi:hypothetical protein
MSSGFRAAASSAKCSLFAATTGMPNASKSSPFLQVNRHAFLKLGNNVARFHFEYMDVPQTTPAFLPRKVEDDELPFDPLTLVPKASPEVKPALDLEAAVPPSTDAKTIAPPEEPQPVVVKNDEDKKEPHEPTQPEVAASDPDPDGPEEGQEEEMPVAEPQPMRI